MIFDQCLENIPHPSARHNGADIVLQQKALLDGLEAGFGAVDTGAGSVSWNVLMLAATLAAYAKRGLNGGETARRVDSQG